MSSYRAKCLYLFCLLLTWIWSKAQNLSKRLLFFKATYVFLKVSWYISQVLSIVPTSRFPKSSIERHLMQITLNNNWIFVWVVYVVKCTYHGFVFSHLILIWGWWKWSKDQVNNFFSGANSTMEPKWQWLCNGWFSAFGPQKNYLCWGSSTTPSSWWVEIVTPQQQKPTTTKFPMHLVFNIF